MTMTTFFTIEKDIHFQRQSRGRQDLRARLAPEPVNSTAARVPRIARLMALAIRLDGLLQSGQIRDQADLARLGQVTRARISQILGLIHLAPDIQEAILFLDGGQRTLDILLADLRPIYAIWDWNGQRRRWRTLRRLKGV
jgi:hypothetical protein